MTDKPVSRLRAISLDPNYRRVLVWARMTSGDFKRVAIPISSIDYVREDGEGGSSIVLRSGGAITVGMEFEELYDKIYRFDAREDVLDLTSVTGFRPQVEDKIAEKKTPVSSALKVCDKMPDGSIYVGLTKDKKSHIFTMSEDLPLSLSFHKAAQKVREMNEKNTLSHNDWEIPSIEVLRQLQSLRYTGFLSGTFRVTSAHYWSSTLRGGDAVELDFADGATDTSGLNGYDRYCRPVRFEPV